MSFQVDALRAWVDYANIDVSETSEDEAEDTVPRKRKRRKKRAKQEAPDAKEDDEDTTALVVLMKDQLKGIIKHNESKVTKSKAATLMHNLLSEKFPDLETFATVAKDSKGNITISFDDVKAYSLNS
jgi:hypothetical protein